MTTRSRWFVLVAVLAGFAAVGAAGIVAFVGVQAYRQSQLLHMAQTQFANEEWQAASINLSRYLPNDPSNLALLTMYAEANAHVLDDRPTALRNVAHAYHQILRYAPGNAEAREQLLELYERQGAWDVLEYYAADWLRSDPDSAILLRARALALDKAGSRDDALAAYDQLFAHHSPTHAELSRYAALLRERSSAQEAEAFLADQLEKHPSDPEVLVALAQYWLDAGDVETAKHYVERASEAAPAFRAQRILSARIAASERRWEDALSLMNVPESDGAIDAELISLRSNVLLASGDAEAAAVMLVETSPQVRIDHPRLQIVLIDSLYGLDRIAEAREASDLYLEAYPLDTATRNYIDGRDALAEKRYADAARALAIAVEMRTDFRAARIALALAEIESGDVQAGRGVLEAYLREYPGDSRAQSLWARHFALTLDQAERLAQRSLDDTTLDAGALIAAAEQMMDTAARSGALAERNRAIVDLAERAMALSPTSPAPYTLLTELSLRLGDPERARGVFTRAQDAGIETNTLNDMAGAIALAERNVSEAWTIFQSAASNLDEDGFRRWAGRFAAAGDYAKARDVFDVAETSLSSATFAADRADLAVEFAPLDEAWAAYETAANHADPNRVNRTRLLLAVRIAESDAAARAARLRELAAAAKNAEQDAAALVVQALNALDAEAPNFEQAESMLLAAAERAPADAVVLDRLRAYYEQRNQLDTAMEFAVRARAEAPGNDRYQFELGRLQALNGLDAEAERTLRDVMNRQPGNSRVRATLVQSLLNAGKTEGAEKVLQGFDDADSDDLDRLRSRILMARDGHAEAEALLRKQLSQDPNDSRARWDLALCLDGMGRAEEAERLLLDATNADGASAQDWSLLARYYAERDLEPMDRKSARAALRALLIDPEFADALHILVQIRERQHDPAAALAILRRYTEARRDDAAAWHRRAQLELATGGSWSDALASVEQAYGLSPTPEFRALRGFIHAGLKQYAEAINDLEEAGSDLPVTSAQFELALAECYLHTNNLEQAEHRLSAAKRKLEYSGIANFPKLAELQALLLSKKDAE